MYEYIVEKLGEESDGPRSGINRMKGSPKEVSEWMNEKQGRGELRDGERAPNRKVEPHLRIITSTN